MKFPKTSIRFSIYLIYLAILVFSHALLTGCVTVASPETELETGNQNITVENMLKIKKGKSTKADIKEIFGDPDSILNSSSDKTTTWVYVYTKTKQYTQERAPHQIDQTQLEIVFNPKDIVTEFTQTVSNKTKREL